MKRTCLARRWAAFAPLLCSGLLSAAGPSNLNFEAHGTLGQTPPGWGMYDSVSGAGYRAALVNQNCVQGGQCVMLTGPASPPANSYGDLAQFISPAGFVSTHLRYTAALRVAGGAHAEMWINIVNTSGTMTFFQNPGYLDSANWTYHTIEVDVAADSAQINFGILILGSGTVWADDLSMNIVGALRQEAPEPPRALTDSGLANLVAFSKLAGYVRYFHPSDQSAVQLDWETFLINGIRSIEDAASPDDLAQRLQSMFDPIAPTVRVFVAGNDPGPVADLSPGSLDGLSVTRWFHQGVSIGIPASAYQSKRVTTPVLGGQIPGNYTDPAQIYEAGLGAGLTARVPTNLYVDSTGTLPHRDSVATTDHYLRTASDRATRLADVMITWNIFQHFYPYFDYIQADMSTALRAALTSAAQNQGPDDFAVTMRLLVAVIQDGHGYVSYNGPTIYTAPVVWAWVENRLIITREKDPLQPKVQSGDRVLSIDGVPAEAALAQMETLESAATPQLLRLKAMEELVYCNPATRSMQLEVEPYSAPGTVDRVVFTCRASDFDWSEPRPDVVTELQPGILYVDIGRLTAGIFAAAIPQLQEATGIVFDFRGYPQIWPPAFIQHLTETPIQSEQFYVPTPALPDQTNMTYSYGDWTLPPLDPFFPGKKVFLIDASAISQAETDMDLVEYYKLADFVGEPTAGTTGDINPFTLPGGFRITWTDLRVLKESGARFYGVGIQPTIPQSRTRQGVAQGIDEILQRGIAAVTGN